MTTRVTDTSHAAFYDSTTMTACGPVFDSPEEAEEFLTWLRGHLPGIDIDERGICEVGRRIGWDSLLDTWRLFRPGGELDQLQGKRP